MLDTRRKSCPAPVLDQTMIPPRLVLSHRDVKAVVPSRKRTRIDIGFGKDPVPYLRQVTRIQGVDGIADGRKIAIQSKSPACTNTL